MGFSLNALLLELSFQKKRAFGLRLFDIATGCRGGVKTLPRTRGKLLEDAMKTVEATKTNPPSLETDWPKKVDTRCEADAGETNWAPQRLRQVLQSSIWENTWHGFRGYDSPLAG